MKLLKAIVAAPIVKPLTNITSLIYSAAHASTAPSVKESVMVIKTKINKIIGHKKKMFFFA